MSEFKGHPRRLTSQIEGNRRLSPFPCVVAVIWGGEIANNAINGSILDTFVPHLKKLTMN